MDYIAEQEKTEYKFPKLDGPYVAHTWDEIVEHVNQEVGGGGGGVIQEQVEEETYR